MKGFGVVYVVACAAVVSYIQSQRSQRYTLLGAMGLDGMKVPWLIGRGAKTVDMVKYVREHLIPALGLGQVLIWDNLDTHHTHELLATVW